MLSQTQIALHSIITLVVRSKFKHVSKEAELRAQLRTLDNLYRTNFPHFFSLFFIFFMARLKMAKGLWQHNNNNNNNNNKKPTATKSK